MTNAVLDALTSRVSAVHRWPDGPGDHGTSTAEHLLHALAASLTASIRHVAGDRLTEIETTVEGETDVRAALGLAGDDPATGFTRVRVTVAADAPLDEILDAALARSAVMDMVAHGVPVDVVTGP
jgi:hypothetical protein